MATRKPSTSQRKDASPSTASKKATLSQMIVETELSPISISARDLQALSPKLKQIRASLEKLDVKRIRKEIESFTPSASDIDRAVKAGMSAYESARKKHKKAKLSTQQEEDMRERLATSLRDDMTGVAIDEDILRFNLERADFRITVLENRAYVVSPTGDVVALIDDLQDSRSLDTVTILEVTSIVLEVAGLVAAIAGLRVAPNQSAVQAVVSNLAKVAEFANAVVEFILDLEKAQNSYDRGVAIVAFVFAIAGIPNAWKEIANAMFYYLPWYQKAWVIAKFVASTVLYVLSAGGALIVKIASCVYQLLLIIEKAVNLIPDLAKDVGAAFRDVRYVRSTRYLEA